MQKPYIYLSVLSYCNLRILKRLLLVDLDESMLFQFPKADFDCYFPFDNMQLFTQNIKELSIHQLTFLRL